MHNEKKAKGRRSLPSQIIIDILIAGILICAFSYFHHIRLLWEIASDPSDTEGAVITRPKELDPPETSDQPQTKTDPDFDTSGMFGKKFADKFLKKGEEKISTDNLYVSNNVRAELSSYKETVNGEYLEYTVIDIFVRDIENLFTKYDLSHRHYFEDIVTDDMIVAISGDYCGNANAAKEVLRNGVEKRATRKPIIDVGILYWDGSFETLAVRDYNRDKILAKSPYQIWNFGPALLDKDGNVKTDFFSTYGDYIAEDHPRQLIGYYEPGHYCFVTIEGRCDRTDGATLKTCSVLIHSLGCRAGFNLDGGASVYTYFNGKMIRYCDEDKQDNPRRIYDIIAIGD